MDNRSFHVEHLLSAWKRLFLLVYGAVVVVLVTVLAVLTVISTTSPYTPRPSSPRAPVEFTTWVSDPNVVTGGPYPGYRPHLSGIGQRRIRTATTALDPYGSGYWVVSCALDDEGSRLLASITKQAARACTAGPGTCPEGHLTIWQGLDKKDLNAWNERGDLLFLPVARGGKLIADLYVRQPITGYCQELWIGRW